MIYRAFKLKKTPDSLIDRIAFILIRTNYFVKNKFLDLISKVFFLNYKGIEVKKIIVLRMGSMGDTVTALPAFTAIRNNFPNAEIDLLTNKFQPGKAHISEILPYTFFNRYYYYKRFVDKDIIQQLRENKYDLYVELSTYRQSLYFELRSFLVAKRIRTRSAIGWHISSDFFLRKKQEKLLKFDTNRVRLLGMIKQYKLQIKDTGWLAQNNSVPVPEFDWDHFVKINFGNRGIIALIPGTGWPENKWPISNYHQIALHFSKESFIVLLIGGEQDYIESETIAQESKKVINLCGKLTVMESAACLNKCLLVISNDTGPMHLAYAVGTPVIALYSNRNYEGKWDPPDDGKNVIIRSDNKIENIPVSKVIAAAERILNTE